MSRLLSGMLLPCGRQPHHAGRAISACKGLQSNTLHPHPSCLRAQALLIVASAGVAQGAHNVVRVLGPSAPGLPKEVRALEFVRVCACVRV